MILLNLSKNKNGTNEFSFVPFFAGKNSKIQHQNDKFLREFGTIIMYNIDK